MEFTAPFGRWLKQRRKQLDLTQGDLARRVTYSPETVRKIEADARRPSREMAERLAEALEIPDAQVRAFVAFATGAEAHHRPSNLPAPATPLIGRNKDVTLARRLLRGKGTRLLTFIGPPGVGKTQLALHVAHQMRDDFADGAWFVPLAPVNDPQLVASAIVQALELPNPSGHAPLTLLKAHLRDKELLLALDNFEQLLNDSSKEDFRPERESKDEGSDAGSIVSDLLAVSPSLRIVTTSRTALRLSGEHLFEVQPLAESDAMQLFVQRTRAIKPDFAVSDGNARVIAEICRRLDGLPLAIELAAVRLRLFSPKVLLIQLNSANSAALDVLSEGPRDLPTRQRTLRTTVAWSYRLLTPEQQRLLRFLSVFARGCAREAAQSVAGHPPLIDTDLQALIDSSLVQHRDDPDGETRFSLLEMIREYAAEQLAACGEVEIARHRHAAYFLEFVKSKAPRVFQEAGSPIHSEDGMTDGVKWLTQLERERNNLTAALAWSLDNTQEDKHDPDIGAQLALWLYWPWSMFGPWSEATYWLERALAQLQPSTPLQLRAGLLMSLARFLGAVSDPARAEQAAQEALALHTAFDDPQSAAMTLKILADVQLERNRLKEARLSSEQQLAIGRAIGDGWHVEVALFYLAEIALCQKDFARVAQLCEECLRMTPDNGAVANLQGTLACYQGSYDRAEALCQQALADFEEGRWSHAVATALHSLGDIAFFRGDSAQTRSRFVESLRLFSENGNKQRAAWCLSGLAAVAATEGQASRAVTLWSAAEAIRASIGHMRPALRNDEYRECVEAVREQLDEKALSVTIAAGQAMSFDQAVEYALAMDD